MSHYILDGNLISPDAPDWQQRLEAAHALGKRLLCPCTQRTPEMVIAKFGSRYFLRRMPDTGHTHDPDCASYEPPAELSGLSQLAGKAIVNGEGGITELKLGFSLTVQLPAIKPSEETRSRTAALTAKTPPARLSLLALLHLLWSEAGLTRWHPRMTDKRSWYIVRREIRRAVQSMRTRRTELAPILYIPQVWSPERKDEIAKERAEFLSKLYPVAGKAQAIGLVLAELKDVAHGRLHHRFVFKHLPDFPFLGSDKLTRNFERIFGGEQKMVEALGNGHIVVLASFKMSATGVAEMTEIASMAVTRHWLPCANMREAQLIEALSGRSWLRTLRFNLSADDPIATGLLTDVTPPLALFCAPGGATKAQVDALKAAADGGSYASWVWGLDETMPSLPAATLRPTRT